MRLSIPRCRHPGLVSIIVLLMVACAFNQPGKERRIDSLSIKVNGYSIAGLQYVKGTYIRRISSGYILRYSCRTIGVPGRQCKCADVERNIRESTIIRLLAEIKTLEDEGERARCCDHSWTEIEVIYPNKSSRKITVAFEPLKVEEILNICRGDFY